MSPPQLLPHNWKERVEVTLYPSFFDCLFATIPPLHVSSISVSEIPRSSAESNFREYLYSRLFLSRIEPWIPQHSFFGCSSNTSNQLTHLCQNKFFFFKIIQPNLISLFCHIWKEFYAGVSKSCYIGISIPIKYSNFSRFYKKTGSILNKTQMW